MQKGDSPLLNINMTKRKSQFKTFIKNHPITNFKKYILEKAKRDPNIYYRVDKEAEQLIIAAEIVALRTKLLEIKNSNLIKIMGTLGPLFSFPPKYHRFR